MKNVNFSLTANDELNLLSALHKELDNLLELVSSSDKAETAENLIRTFKFFETQYASVKKVNQARKGSINVCPE